MIFLFSVPLECKFIERLSCFQPEKFSKGPFARQKTSFQDLFSARKGVNVFYANFFFCFCRKKHSQKQYSINVSFVSCEVANHVRTDEGVRCRILSGLRSFATSSSALPFEPEQKEAYFKCTPKYIKFIIMWLY